MRLRASNQKRLTRLLVGFSLGGFFSNCHALTSVEMAKEENHMNELIPLCIAIALLIYYNPISIKPLYQSTSVNINELTEWRYRLGITEITAAELLGISLKDYEKLENCKNPIDKVTQLACLTCELAYIAADQYVKANPLTYNNIGTKNYVEHHGRRYIRDSIMNGKNPISSELSILLTPKSLIQREDKK
jgi:DNA-binding XRE family transcriptional regulator